MTTIPLNSSFEPRLWLVIICTILMIFDFIMKWVALYRAGKREELTRFVCLFIFNTCWILPLIYLIYHKNKN